MISHRAFHRKLMASVAAGKITRQHAMAESAKRRRWMDSQKPPGLIEKAANFASSAVKHVAAGMPMCTEEEVARRFAICQGCEFYKDNACLKCGCPVQREKQFLSKLSWANEKCPVGKWGNSQ